MGDVIPIKQEDTPKTAAEQLLANVKDTDLTLIGMIVQEDGAITITASPMASERMYYLGGILKNFVMNQVT